MDPEQIQELLALVARAREAGHDDRAISRILRRNNQVPFSSVRALEAQAEAQGVGNAQAAPTPSRNPLQPLVPGIQGATGGFASDAVALLDRLGLAPEGSAERFREDLETERQENPARSAALQGAGLLAGPARLAGSLAVRGAKAAGGVGRRAGAAAARGAGGGELAQLAAGGAGAGLGAALGGAGISGLEGFAASVGESAGQPLPERLEAGVAPGVVSALIGGPLAGLGIAVGSARQVNRLRAQRGEVLADAAEGVASGLPARREVARRVSQADEARRAAFQEAEALGQRIPVEVTEAIAENSIALRAVRNAASQGSPEARRFLRGIEAFEAGERASIPAVSFSLADDVRKQLKEQASAFARRGLSATDAPASQGAVREASRVRSLIQDALEDVPSFPEALRQTARAAQQDEAFQAGRKMFSKTAGEIEDVLAGQKVRVGSRRVNIANSPEAREAFRSGLAVDVIEKLRGGSQVAESFIEQAKTSSALQSKLRVILGGESELQQFLAEADRLRAIGQASRINETLIKAAGFLGFGTSLFGGVGALAIN